MSGIEWFSHQIDTKEAQKNNVDKKVDPLLKDKFEKSQGKVKKIREQSDKHHQQELKEADAWLDKKLNNNEKKINPEIKKLLDQPRKSLTNLFHNKQEFEQVFEDAGSILMWESIHPKECSNKEKAKKLKYFLEHGNIEWFSNPKYKEVYISYLQNPTEFAKEDKILQNINEDGLQNFFDKWKQDIIKDWKYESLKELEWKYSYDEIKDGFNSLIISGYKRKYPGSKIYDEIYKNFLLDKKRFRKDKNRFLEDVRHFHKK